MTRKIVIFKEMSSMNVDYFRYLVLAGSFLIFRLCEIQPYLVIFALLPFIRLKSFWTQSLVQGNPISTDAKATQKYQVLSCFKRNR